MSSKKNTKLKRIETLTETQWIMELKFIEGEVIHVIDIFNFYEEINRLSLQSEAAFDALRSVPLFWPVQRDCMQESLFMGLGRLCDSSPDAINVNRVLNTAMIHPEFFSEQVFRRRLKHQNLGKEHIDNILAVAWMPKDKTDWKYLKKAVTFHLSKIEQIYRPIRNAHYGHRLADSDIHAMFSKTNRKELGETLDALHELMSGLLSLYQNGTKPEIGVRDFEPYNDKIKGYVRTVIEKLAGKKLTSV